MLPMVQEAYVINMMGKYGRNLLTYSSFQRKIQDPSGMQTPYFLFIFFFFFRLGTNTKHFETAGFYKQSFPWKVLSKSYKSIVKALTQLN